MSSPKTRQVLHLSGQDSPGIVAEFSGLLNQGGAEILHLTQHAVHGFFAMSAEVGQGTPQLIDTVRAFAKRVDAHLDVTELPAQAQEESGCGIWVTLLGKICNGAALSKVSATLKAEGFLTTRIKSIGQGKMVGINLLAEKPTLPTAEFEAIRKKLLTESQSLSVDLAVQRDDVYRVSKRLLCMDVDSTFVKGEFIDELAELVGVKDQVAEITNRAMQGELDFEASLRARVALLKGLPMSRAKELCNHYELTPGADELVRTAKQLGMRVGLVSGGFDFFVEALKEKFGLDFAFANELEVVDEKLTGNVVGAVVTPARKAQVLKDMSHVFGVRLEQTIAAGDGANDIEMLQTAGLGIAYQAKPRLQEVADTRFNQHDRLDTLLYLMGYDAKKIIGACK